MLGAGTLWATPSQPASTPLLSSFIVIRASRGLILVSPLACLPYGIVPALPCPLVPSSVSGTEQALCKSILTDKICQENFQAATLDHVQSLPSPAVSSQPFLSCFTASGVFLFHFCFTSLYCQALSVSRAPDIIIAYKY